MVARRRQEERQRSKEVSGRPDFTLRKFEVFAGVFNVAELKALNDAQKFRHSTFQAKAAELHERATGPAAT